MQLALEAALCEECCECEAVLGSGSVWCRYWFNYILEGTAVEPALCRRAIDLVVYCLIIYSVNFFGGRCFFNIFQISVAQLLVCQLCLLSINHLYRCAVQ